MMINFEQYLEDVFMNEFYFEEAFAEWLRFRMITG